MKPQKDEAVAEVRTARKALCDRFGNNARRLLTRLREEQRHYQGRVIRHWSELETTSTLREAAPQKKSGGK